MATAVLCIEFKPKNTGGSITQHDGDCRHYKKHVDDAKLMRFGALFEGDNVNIGTLSDSEMMLWTEAMPSNLAVLKGTYLAKLLQVFYKKVSVVIDSLCFVDR